MGMATRHFKSCGIMSNQYAAISMFVVCKCTYVHISNVLWISRDGLIFPLQYKWLFGKFCWIGFSTLVDFHEVFLIIMPKYFVRNLKHMEFSMSLFHPFFRRRY